MASAYRRPPCLADSSKVPALLFSAVGDNSNHPMLSL
jgi:hypothetical protein